MARAVDRVGLDLRYARSSRSTVPRPSHSAASILLAQGIAARTVMEQLGHSQIALTLDRYTHVPSALMEEAAQEMDRALGS